MEMRLIGLRCQNFVCFLTYGHRLSADVGVPIVIRYAGEGALIHNGLILLPAGPFFTFPGQHSHRAVLNTFNHLPWFGVSFVYGYAVKPDVLKQGDKFMFLKCARNAATPQRVIFFEMIG